MVIKKAPDTSTYTNKADDDVLAEVQKLSGGDLDKRNEWLDAEDGAAPPLTAGDEVDDDDNDPQPGSDAGAGDDPDQPANDDLSAEERAAQEAQAAADAEAARLAAEQAATDAAAAAAAAAAAPTPAPAPVELANIPEPEIAEPTLSRSEIATKRAEAKQAIADAFALYSDGKMDAAAFSAEQAKQQDVLDEVSQEAALYRHAEGVAQKYRDKVLTNIKAHGKALGLDYDADADAPVEFDAALSVLQASPRMQGKTYAQLAQQAHKTVLGARGIALAKPNTPAPPAPAAPAAPAPASARTTPPAPPSLRGVPSAAAHNSGGGLAEQLSRLEGLDYQDATARARSTPQGRAQHDAWLDS